MMKLTVFFLIISIYIAQLDVSTIRGHYKEAVVSKESTLSLHEKLEKTSLNDDIRLVAYKGAVTALMARYEKGVQLKGETFKNGIEWIEYAVKKDTTNIEVHFVRLSIQQNSPKFLKYNKDIQRDKEMILNNFFSIKSKAFQDYLKGYIISSDNFTEEEKKSISL